MGLRRGRGELYDYHADPMEFHNLAADPDPRNAAVIERLRKALHERASGKIPLTPFQPKKIVMVSLFETVLFSLWVFGKRIHRSVSIEVFKKGAMRFLTVFLLLASFHTVRAEESPNILLIITDEHNFRTLGCYRDHLSKEQAEMWGPGVIVKTPNIDRLASEGVICTRAYCDCAGLFTLSGGDDYRSLSTEYRCANK